MDWASVLTIVGANMAVVIPLFFWNRAEANADRRMSYDLISQMKDEMRDFHGRLCAIEERYKASK